MDRTDTNTLKRSHATFEMNEVHDEGAIALLDSKRVAAKKSSIGLVFRALPITLVVVPLLVSAVVAMMRVLQYRSHGTLYTLATERRASVQVTVHVISTTLSLLLTTSLCMAINLSARQILADRAFTLNQLRLVFALSKKYLDPTLPSRLLILSAGFCAIAAFPGWLWTGALTPQITKFQSNGTVSVPKTGTGAYDFLTADGYWSWSNTTAKCWQETLSNGSFTNCPSLYHSGDLLQSCGSATAINGTLRYHPKLDKTALSYVQRSYGVGASAGLAAVEPRTLATYSPQGYIYRENGYMTNATCIRNMSSAWQFDLSQTIVGDGTYPSLFLVSGLFPNSNWEPGQLYGNGGTLFFGQASFGDGPDRVVSLGSINGWQVDIPDYYLALAAGSDYSALDKIQCQLFFEPTSFTVNVSVTDNTLTVSPIEAAQDMEPSGILRSNVMLGLTAISMVETTLYVSTLGEALMSNAANLHSRNGYGNTNATEAEVLTAVQDSILSMTDDLLEMFAGAALAQSGYHQEQAATFSAEAVEIGAPGFIIAIFVVNLVAFAVVAIAAVWSQCWVRVSLFDVTDPSALASAVYIRMAEKGGQEVKHGLGTWNGNPRYRELGNTVIRIRESSPPRPPAVGFV